MTINFDKIFLVRKSTIIFGIYCFAICFAYWTSLMAWFLWPLLPLYIPLTAILVAGTMFLSYYYTEENFFNREHYGLPTLMVALVIITYRLVHGANVMGIIEGFMHIFVFYSLFRLNIDYLKKLIHIVCISMGGFLTISIGYYFIYLLGFPLPSTPIVTEDMMYSFDNFYLFLTNDNSFFIILQRFHSVFLEPGHLGTATTFLLLTQIGQWKKWYNIVLLIATVLSFSLAAYVLLVMTMIASAWIQHKQFIMKIIAIILVLAGVGIGAFLYDQGDNMLYSMIIERLEVDDGKLVGDNRVTESFEAVYNDYLKSDDILFGKVYKLEDFGFGNAGYRVYIYDNGIVGLLLIIVFYLSIALYGYDFRSTITMLLIAAAAFWVRSTPLAFYYFLPLYCILFMRKGSS